MVTATKISSDSTKNNYDASVKVSKGISNSISDLYSSYGSKTAYGTDNFKQVLNFTTNYKDDDNAKQAYSSNEKVISNENVKNNPSVRDASEDKVTDDKSSDDIDELKDKLEELDEKSKKASSKEDTQDVLQELLALLAKFGLKQEDLKANGNVNSDMLKNILDSIKNGKSNDANNILKNIMELLKNDSVKSGLNPDMLKTIEKVLGNISSNLGNNSETSKNLQSNIKNLMSEISDMLNGSKEQTNRVLSLEDMLNKNYSQDSSNNASGDGSSDTSANNKEVSKDSKFLNSLINDKNDNNDKINLFASRASLIQNQGVTGTERGLTINKATFVNDLIKDVKFMSSNSIKELTVKLNPGSLGEITIKLVQEDGIMKANLKAGSKETTALLSQNLGEIKKQLSDQNIKIADVNIELYQDDTTFFKDQGFAGQFAGEQNKQSNNSNNSTSTAERVEGESLDDNLAKDNSELNIFA